MTAVHVNDRVKRYREMLRKSGLRPVQLWVPDTRLPGFEDECRRQSEIAARAEKKNSDLEEFMDEALRDVDGWDE